MGKQHIEKGGVFCAVLTNWLPLRLELTLQEVSFFFFFLTLETGKPCFPQILVHEHIKTPDQVSPTAESEDSLQDTKRE